MRSRGSITTETVNVMWDTDMIEANGYGNTYIHRLGACVPKAKESRCDFELRPYWPYWARRLVAAAHAPWADGGPSPLHQSYPHYFYNGGNVVGEFENGQPVCSSSGSHGHHERTKEELAACNAARQQWIADHSWRPWNYRR